MLWVCSGVVRVWSVVGVVWCGCGVLWVWSGVVRVWSVVGVVWCGEDVVLWVWSGEDVVLWVCSRVVRMYTCNAIGLPESFTCPHVFRHFFSTLNPPCSMLTLLYREVRCTGYEIV